MAMRHRKLFPAPTTTNQTVDCPDFCDPACPDNCYPYSDYFFLPPPPPPPPSPSLLSQEHHLSPYVIIIVSVLASLVLLVSYYVIVIKSSSSWCGLRSNRQPGDPADDTDEELLDENGVDHPIWYITTIGLQQSIINSITVCRYKKGEGLVEGSECSVCLSEFQQDETLKLLPKCSHAFHISCIDTWLRSHTNCPLCRAHIVSDAVAHPPVSVNQQPENLQTIVSIEMENTEVGAQSANALDRNENRAGAEGVGEVVQVSDDIISKENVNADSNGEVQIVCDSGDNELAVKDDIQPMRRYFTTDSLTAAASIFLGPPIHKPIESEGGGTSGVETENAGEIHSTNVLKRDGRWSSSFRLLRSSSIAQCLHKAPVPMKRSYSCGGRFFPSRQSGSLNSVLPL